MSVPVTVRSPVRAWSPNRLAIVFAVAVLSIAVAVATWNGSVRLLSVLEGWTGATTGEAGSGALGVVLASSSVPDVVADNSAAIGALLVLVVGALIVLTIVSRLASGT